MPSSAGSQLGHPRRSSNSLVACRCARGLSSSLLFNTMLPTRPKEGRAKKNHWAMLGNQIFYICHVCVGMIKNCFCWSITCRQIKTPKMTQMRLQFHSLFCKQTFYSNEGGISVWGRAEEAGSLTFYNAQLPQQMTGLLPAQCEALLLMLPVPFLQTLGLTTFEFLLLQGIHSIKQVITLLPWEQKSKSVLSVWSESPQTLTLWTVLEE